MGERGGGGPVPRCMKSNDYPVYTHVHITVEQCKIIRPLLRHSVPKYVFKIIRILNDCSAKEGRKNSQELTQFGPRSHPRLLVGKRPSQNKTPSKTSPGTAR